jgi:hypothetical protein
MNISRPSSGEKTSVNAGGMRIIPPKKWTLTRLQSTISLKIEVFIAAAVRTRTPPEKYTGQ